MDESVRPANDAAPEWLTDSALDLYARLAVSGRTPRSELTAVEAADLAALIRLRLARESQDSIEAVAPHSPMDSLLRAGEQAMARTRAVAETLEVAWRDRPDRSGAIEYLQGEASKAAYEQMLAEADSVCALNRATVGRPMVASGAFDLLDRGLSIRVVYDSTLLSNPEALSLARSCIEAGEQARVLPGVPATMMLTSSAGTLSLPDSQGVIPDRLIIHSPRILGAFRQFFETLWSVAVPMSATSEVTAGRQEDIALLTLLAAGLTDHSIGRELGISERTVRRRITVLQALLGAQTRFQLGAQAVRQGWLGG